MRLAPVDHQQISAFERDGAVCIRQLFSPSEIALLSEGIEANLAHLSPRAKVASSAGDPGLSSRTSAAGRRTKRTAGSSSSRGSARSAAG